jgi:hypothetical protein
MIQEQCENPLFPEKKQFRGLADLAMRLLKNIARGFFRAMRHGSSYRNGDEESKPAVGQW